MSSHGPAGACIPVASASPIHVFLIQRVLKAKVSGTCFWNSNTKQLGDLCQKQKIKESLWNLCAVYAALWCAQTYIYKYI